MLRHIVFALGVCVLSGATAARAADNQVFVLGGQEPRGSFLGVVVGDVDAERMKALSLKEERGAEIRSVQEDSPAAKAGLKGGDVVLMYNDERVYSAAQFQRLVRETPPGRDVKLTVSRGGATQILTAKTDSRPEFGWVQGSRRFEMPPHWTMPELQAPEMPDVMQGGSSRRLGIQGEAVEGQLASYFGVKQGVLVRSVRAGSPAERAGIRAGDVITKINNETIDAVRDISSALRSGASKTSATVVLTRDKREMTVTVTLEEAASGNGEQV